MQSAVFWHSLPPIPYSYKIFFHILSVFILSSRHKKWQMCVILYSSLCTGSQSVISSTFIDLTALSSLYCIYCLLSLSGNEAKVGNVHFQTSLRNSGLTRVGMWVESMVRDDGLNGNKTRNMCLKPTSSCWVILLLWLCLNGSYKGHCYPFFKFIQGSMKVWNSSVC